MSWRLTAEMDTADDRLLGEDERGDLWIPSRRHSEWWDRRFNPRNPLHWRYWLRSRLTGRLGMIETPGSYLEDSAGSGH